MDDDIPGVNDLFDDILEGGAPDSAASESAVEEPQTPTDAEFMGEKGGVVTGRGRMEAAFGSGDGDETATAQVAQVASEATGGTLFLQQYRPWRGELNTRWVRNWAILRYHVYGLFSKGHKPWPMMTK